MVPEHGRRHHARLKAWQKGKNAERFAAWALRFRGYRILATRYKTSFGEIDLIASPLSGLLTGLLTGLHPGQTRTLVFVEVKARATPGAGLEAISPRQQQRIKTAAEAFLARNYRGGEPVRCRFDAMVVSPGFLGFPRITHRRNAWT